MEINIVGRYSNLMDSLSSKVMAF